jgi:hypothetical protein
LDGDFAVSAPLYVLPTGSGRVHINEIVPAPAADHNLDADPNLLRLLDPAGVEADRLDWGGSPAPGRSLSRYPDGQSWVWHTPATPGQPNQPAPPEAPAAPPKQNEDAPAPSNAQSIPLLTLDPVDFAKFKGLQVVVELRVQVTAPPGLFNSSIYVADPVPDPTGSMLAFAGSGIHVYLRNGHFPPLQEGEWIKVRGRLDSFRGEMELELRSGGQVQRLEIGAPLLPAPVASSDIGEKLEGRLVTFTGVVSGWQGDSLYLADPMSPTA